MEEAKKVLSAASKKNGRPVEPDQIVLTKPSTAAAGGSFLDIMKHPVLRYQTLIMYFNWFTTAFIMYGLALSWQQLTGTDDGDDTVLQLTGLSNLSLVFC